MLSLIKDFTKNMNKMYKKTIKKYNWKNILILFALILLSFKIYNNYKPQVENFTSFQKEKLIVKKGNQIYDDFYCSIYDKLVLDPVKNNFVHTWF